MGKGVGEGRGARALPTHSGQFGPSTINHQSAAAVELYTQARSALAIPGSEHIKGSKARDLLGKKRKKRVSFCSLIKGIIPKICRLFLS